MADENTTTVESVLQEQYGLENGSSLFGETETGVEAADVETDVLGEDESLDDAETTDAEDVSEEDSSEDDTSEEEAEVEDDSSAAQLEEVNNNLKRAMQSERAKRKEATERVTNLETEISLLKKSGSDDKYTSLVEQIKELGLEDVLSVDAKPALDPRVQEMLDAQEAARQQAQQEESMKTFKSTMHDEVHANVGNYKNIDTGNEQQGGVLAQMIVADVIQGAEVEDAVAKNLKLLDALLAPAKRTPQVKPKPKPRAATKTTKDVTQRRQAQAVQNGDVSSVFADIGRRLAGE